MSVDYKPKGYQDAVPYIMAKDARGLMEFLQKTFNATLIEQMVRADGSIMHGEARVGDSVFMISEATEQWPATLAGYYIYVPNVDETYKQAVAAGGVSIMEPADQVHGDRMAGVKDHSGNSWWIATHFEDVSSEEVERRYKEMQQGQPA